MLTGPAEPSNSPMPLCRLSACLTCRGAGLQHYLMLLVQELEEPAERDRFQSTIPQQLTVIWNTLQAGDEGTAQEALELFIEVAEAHPRFLRKNLTEIVNAMLQVDTI